MSKKRRKWLKYLIYSLFFFLLLIKPIFSQNIPTSLTEQAEQAYQQGNLLESEQAFQNILTLLKDKKQDKTLNFAITLTNLGQVQLDLGKYPEALGNLETATPLYTTLLRDTKDPRFLRSQIYLALALQNLGFYPRACNYLSQALHTSENICQDSDTKVNLVNPSTALQPIELKGWRVLSDILRGMGNLETSEAILISILPYSPEPESVELSLGNVLTEKGNQERDRQAPNRYNYIPWYCEEVEIEASAKDDILVAYQEAAEHYRQAAELSISPSTKVKAQLSYLALLVEKIRLNTYSAEDISTSRKLLLYLPQVLGNLPISQSKIYLEVKFAKLRLCLGQLLKTISPEDNPVNLLNNALQEADRIDNKLIKSYVLGNFGGVYEYAAEQKNPIINENFCQNQADCLAKAQQLTQEALYLIQPIESPQLAYQWQWQLGRLLAAQEQRQLAIDTYESAINTLDTARNNILNITSDVQFSFRDNVEPIYRELITLLLTDKEYSSSNLWKVIYYLDSLQLAELQNFLKCDLGEEQKFLLISRTETKLARFKENVNKIFKKESLLIVPVITPDSLGIIYKLPNQEPRIIFSQQNFNHQEITQDINKLQKSLQFKGRTPEVIESSSKIYPLLYKPLESILFKEKSIKNLVFVLDSLFRNIPMGVLYSQENQKYLIQSDYTLAILPSLNLESLQNRLEKRQLKILSGGVGIQQKIGEIEFEPIDNLETDLQEINQNFKSSKLLIDNKFTKANIEKYLSSEDFSIIHWKTHGQFSSDPSNNYLVAYQDKITANNLEQMLQKTSPEKPIELFVLSACETAQGDNRAILGLSGIAVRSGINTTISTIWKADSRANTDLMIKFYEELSQLQVSKAEALHKAQLSLLETYNSPYIWANYILVGNWE